MTEYIDKAKAAAEITLAYQDGRIGTLEDILGVLDLLPSAGAGIAKLRERLKAYEDTGLAPEEVAALKAGQARARDEAKGGSGQDGDDAVLYAVVKDGSEAVNVSAAVYGSVDSALVGLTVLISDVAQQMGRDFVSLCIALAANPPAWLAGRDHQ